MRLQLSIKEIAFAILFLLKIYKNSVTAERTCYACNGINCLRTSSNVTRNCIDDLDICVTVFEGQTVVYQGCLEQLSEKLRNKCNSSPEVINDQQNSAKLTECFKCNENLCNNLASETFNCIQCDSKSDINCSSKPENFTPERCLISRTPNEYCFTKREGDRVVRGCSQTLEQQTACLSSEECMICQPSEISGCNNDSGVNGSEEDGSGNAGVDGNANDNNEGGNSDSGSDDSGNGSSDNGSSGSDSESNANNNTGGGNSESGAGSGNNESGSTSDSSGNSNSENSNSGTNNGSSSNDNSEGGASSSNGSNGSSITNIVNTFVWIFTIFLIYSLTL